MFVQLKKNRHLHYLVLFFCAAVSLVTQHVAHALVRKATTVSLAPLRMFWLDQRVSPNVRMERSTVKILLPVNLATQIVKHAVDRLLATARLVEVF